MARISDATKSVLLHYRFRVVPLLCWWCICHGVEKKGAPPPRKYCFRALLHSFRDLQLGKLDVGKVCCLKGV